MWLKLRPYGAIQIGLLLLFLSKKPAEGSPINYYLLQCFYRAACNADAVL